MQVLVVTRGAPGSGKTTTVNELGLAKYTLDPDEIRLMFQPPLLTPEGGEYISQKNDKDVWGFLFQVLEKRMEQGNFTVVSGTHSKTSDFKRYAELCDKYRYRLACLDFGDVPLEECKRRNLLRDTHKQVSEEIIENFYSRLISQPVPASVPIVKPENFWEYFTFPPKDLNEYKKIHVVGDIHGCYTVLNQYLDGGKINPDEFYIFVGDILDRGIENDQVLKFFLGIYKLPNVVILFGNHEKHLLAWANDQPIKYREFKETTQKQIEQAGIQKKSVRNLCRKFWQMITFTYGGNKFVVTHGGLPYYPNESKSVLISSDQIIRGVGDYEDDIDSAFNTNTKEENVYQIHGHRNNFNLPIVNGRSLNLNHSVEHGGDLRAVTIDSDGIHPHEIRNEVFGTLVFEDEIKNEEPKTLLLKMRSNRYINERQFGNVSSFSFSNEVFYGRLWDLENVKARGLFLNTNTEEIVIRSWDKYFNLNERHETKVPTLQGTLSFPLVTYEKYNGFLGLVGHDGESDQLLLASKSTLTGPFAKLFQEMFNEKFGDRLEEIKEFVKNNNVSLAFEVIEPNKDPHIVEYKEKDLILLDIIYREETFRKYSYEDMVKVAKYFGMNYKRLGRVITNWTDFLLFLNEVDDSGEEDALIEGYVIEDSKGFQFKLKTPGYNFWKRMRWVKDNLIKKNTVRGGVLLTPLANNFYKFMRTKFMEDREAFIKQNIISLRNQFYQEQLVRS